MLINCKGTLIDLASPKVMGAINLNSSSFYSESRTKNKVELLVKVEKMLEEGADFIDLGFMSSRPGALISDPDEEKNVILPAVEAILDEFANTLISIDTIHSKVAGSALRAGAAIINDISAGDFDQKMIETVASFRAPYIMMHMRGNPENMQNQTSYENVVLETLTYLIEKRKAAIDKGIHDVIIDPGFGFAKTVSQNFELLSKLQTYKISEAPILVGISRKSMIYKTLNSSPQEALTGTIVLNTIALQKGANILRVHDVKEAKETILLFQKLQEFN